jgi:hypothetical protein
MASNQTARTSKSVATIEDGNMSTSQQSTTPAPVPKKSGKSKKNSDPADAGKQIAAKIAQLEQDAAGEKDQDVEIGMCCNFMNAGYGLIT